MPERLAAVRFSYTYLGTLMQNQAHYVVTTPDLDTPLAPALSEAFGFEATLGAGLFPVPTFMSFLQKAQSLQVSYREFLIRDVFSDTDFSAGAITTGAAGTAAGQSSPSFVSFGLFQGKVRQSVRRGTMRIGGVSEDSATGNTLTPSAQTALDEVATALNFQQLAIADLLPTDWLVSPASLKYQRAEVNGKVTYSYFDDIATQLANAAWPARWSAATVVTSQTSRK